MKAACNVELGGRVVEGEMSEKIYDVPAEWAKRAFVDQAKYKEMYAHSVTDSDRFWADHARRID
jgi:acetyl-CoA synthetase